MAVKASSSKPRKNQDHPWKDTMEDLFPWMIRFCNARLYHLIDWGQGYTFLDKELRQIMPRKGKKGRRYVDKLARVTMKNGDMEHLYIHSEFQGEVEEAFDLRMFTYFYRLFDHYGQRVYSMAILGDSTKSWKPMRFSYKKLNCKLRFDFPVIKLNDYLSQWDRLERSRNPFALVVMAYLKAREVASDVNELARWKFHYMRMAIKRGYQPKEIRAIIRFLEWVMKVPEVLDRKLEQELDKELGGGLMALRTRWEIAAEERALSRTLLKQLTTKFGEIPTWVKEKVGQAESDLLETWLNALIQSSSVKEVFATRA